MLTRNWLDLSRKLVDRFDMNYSFDAVQQALGEYALAWFGHGVVITTTYPNPFAITLSSMVLGGSVSNGIAFDTNGQLTSINASSTSPRTFVLSPSDPTNPRWDLLCLEYLSAGDTQVPKPSDPLAVVYLNLHDDFRLVVVPGTPSATPAYPAKGNPLYIVLAGIQVPRLSTLGTQCTIDYTPREQANANLSSLPVVIQEVPAGAINGANASFTLSQPAINAASILVKVDGITQSAGTDWSIIGQVITLNPAPAVGQSVDVWYIANSVSSQNPLAGAQEVPSGVANGVNTLFALQGKPANQASTMVFIDGLEIPVSQWTLIQGPTNGSINFGASSIPQTGQDVYVFYLVNPFIFGVVPPMVAPPSGTGALVAYGSSISPQIIAAASGLPATSDQRQLWVVSSAGGAQTITAIPQINPGLVVGQELDIQGTSASNYIKFQDGNGLSLNGPIDLTNNGAISLVWNGSVWAEISRR